MCIPYFSHNVGFFKINFDTDKHLYCEYCIYTVNIVEILIPRYILGSDLLYFINFISFCEKKFLNFKVVLPKFTFLHFFPFYTGVLKFILFYYYCRYCWTCVATAKD